MKQQNVSFEFERKMTLKKLKFETRPYFIA